jgi:hypothetical protein
LPERLQIASAASRALSMFCAISAAPYFSQNSASIKSEIPSHLSGASRPDSPTTDFAHRFTLK